MERLPARVNKILDAVANNQLEVKIDAIDEARLMEGFQKVANRITLGLLLRPDHRRGDAHAGGDVVPDSGVSRPGHPVLPARRRRWDCTDADQSVPGPIVGSFLQPGKKSPAHFPESPSRAGICVSARSMQRPHGFLAATALALGVRDVCRTCASRLWRRPVARRADPALHGDGGESATNRVHGPHPGASRRSVERLGRGRGRELNPGANPDPPVLHMERFVTRLDWRALLHRRVVPS